MLDDLQWPNCSQKANSQYQKTLITSMSRRGIRYIFSVWISEKRNVACLCYHPIYETQTCQIFCVFVSQSVAVFLTYMVTKLNLVSLRSFNSLCRHNYTSPRILPLRSYLTFGDVCMKYGFMSCNTFWSILVKHQPHCNVLTVLLKLWHGRIITVRIKL